MEIETPHGQSPFAKPPNAKSSATENARSSCLSLLERYERLRLGSLALRQLPSVRETPDTSVATANSHTISTPDTRDSVEELMPGVLPVSGASLHLGEAVQRRLKRSPELEKISGISDQILVPQHSSLSESRGRNIYDLYEQNQEWMETLMNERRTASSHILYSPSGTTQDSSRNQSQTITGEISEEEDMFIPTPEGTNRLSDNDRSESLNRLAQYSGTDSLVALARRGEFSQLWEAIRTARMRMGAADKEGKSVYHDAVESFLSEWSDFTTVKGLIVRKRHNQLIRDDNAIGSSFMTCDAWFEEQSNELDLFASYLPQRIPNIRHSEETHWRQYVGYQICNEDHPSSRYDGNRRCIAVIRRTTPSEVQQ